MAIPTLYNYIQHVQSTLQPEVEFCRHKTGGLYAQYEKLQEIVGVRDKNVERRQAGYGGGYSGSYGGGSEDYFW